MNRRQRVLLISDDESLTEAIRSRLKDLGVDLHLATTSTSGLSAAQQEGPDLVLLHADMSDTDPYELCRRLKQDSLTRSIPVIFLSDDDGSESCKVQGFSAGASDFVTLPFNDAEFCARVGSVLKTRALVEMLETQARSDSLTGLSNRERFRDALSRCVMRARTFEGYRFAVLFLDLDRFKIINDSLGHAAGDQLLITVSKRLRRCVRCRARSGSRGEGDEVARMGGDEFVILLDDIHSVDDVTEVAGRLTEELAMPYILDGMEMSAAVSIGIRLGDGTTPGADDLLRDCDTAMYHAKERGRDRYVFFDQQMHDEAMHRMSLEHDLRKALDRGQFIIVYQPIVSLDSGELCGFEALLRWHHPQHGIVSPAQFIPIAEETGQIVPIGEWVLKEACRQLREWMDRYPNHPPLSMNINVSKKQLGTPSLRRAVMETLDEYELPPDLVKLEVTESTIVEGIDAMIPMLEELKKLGVKLAMDDFGTGYSSLSCLHRFPIDVLKIDRAFIENMGFNVQYAAITQAVVTLAHNLNMTVVAEGIETSDQLAQLQALDCDYAQGYLISRPADAEQVEPLIAARKPLAKSA